MCKACRLPQHCGFGRHFAAKLLESSNQASGCLSHVVQDRDCWSTLPLPEVIDPRVYRAWEVVPVDLLREVEQVDPGPSD
eukprot:7582058-Heterocapsa_arctica.AAC.1